MGAGVIGSATGASSRGAEDGTDSGEREVMMKLLGQAVSSVIDL
jgi:hypothetical protein